MKPRHRRALTVLALANLKLEGRCHLVRVVNYIDDVQDYDGAAPARRSSRG
jgi:hypothetical protein